MGFRSYLLKTLFLSRKLEINTLKLFLTSGKRKEDKREGENTRNGKIQTKCINGKMESSH